MEAYNAAAVVTAIVVGSGVGEADDNSTVSAEDVVGAAAEDDGAEAASEDWGGAADDDGAEAAEEGSAGAAEDDGAEAAEEDGTAATPVPPIVGSWYRLG